MVEEVFRDPTGFEVILTEKCWTEHIIQRHPEIGQYRDLVIGTIKQPDAIYLGKRDPSRRIYLKKYPQVTGIGKWLDLLVFAGNQDRHIATAYFAAYAMRMLGEQIWPSK